MMKEYRFEEREWWPVYAPTDKIWDSVIFKLNEEFYEEYVSLYNRLDEMLTKLYKMEHKYSYEK